MTESRNTRQQQKAQPPLKCGFFQQPWRIGGQRHKAVQSVWTPRVSKFGSSTWTEDSFWSLWLVVEFYLQIYYEASKCQHAVPPSSSKFRLRSFLTELPRDNKNNGRCWLFSARLWKITAKLDITIWATTISLDNTNILLVPTFFIPEITISSL
jgi:hypothetical protein